MPSLSEGSSLTLSPSAGLRVTTFASGLDFPSTMTPLADGSLLVGTTTPSSVPGFTAYYLGSGQLVRYTDPGNTGVANGPGVVVASGLPGAVTSVRQIGDLIAVATAGNMTTGGFGEGDITFFRPGATPTSLYTQVGSMHVSFPSFDAAINLTLAASPVAGAPGSYDLFFGLGAGNNSGAPAANVNVTGLVSASLPAGSLYEMTVNTSGSTPSVSSPVQIADGIRNTGGMIPDQGNGNLYFGDNGYEDSQGAPISADELNVITPAELASGVTFFGYPGNYTNATTGAFAGGAGQPPIAAFLSSGNSQSVGLAELALAPTDFPDGLDNGIFGGFDGDFNHAGILNQTNPVIYYDFTTGTYTDFIVGGQAGVGHLIGIASTPDALFLADLSSLDGWSGGSGVIYEISAAPVPELSSALLAGIGLALLLGVRSAQSTPGRRWKRRVGDCH